MLGPSRVGAGSLFAANAGLLTGMPDHAAAVGVPAQVVRVRGEKVNYTDTVDQTSVKNPTLEKLGTLAARVELLEKQVNQMKKEK